MKIAFRVDASNQIGTGHFMRCLTLADEFKQYQPKIFFISRFLPEHLKEILNEKGYQFLLLSNVQKGSEADTKSDLLHSSWLRSSQERDALDTLKLITIGLVL